MFFLFRSYCIFGKLKNKRQHIIAFVLLIAIMFPLCVVLLTYTHEMKQVKRTVKWKILHGIPLDELVYFEYDMQDASFAQLNWKHNKEFGIDGNMFDIVKGDTIGNIVTYYCYPDHQETALNTYFDSQLSKFFASDKDSKTKSYKLNNLITNLYIVRYQIHLIPNYSYLSLLTFTKNEQKQWKAQYKGPPPKFS